MASQCRACLSTISNEFIHLGSDFTEEQTYFQCFNECTQLQSFFEDEFPQVICQTCLNALHISYEFIKTAQKSDLILRDRLNNKAQEHNEIFQEADIENMEIVVLESLEEPMLKEQVELDDYNYLISEDDEYQIDSKSNFKLTCQLCNDAFELPTQLEQHLRDEHYELEGNDGFIALATCETCQKTFESNENLDLHTLIFHRTNTDSNCALCSESIGNDFGQISQHISIKHPAEYAKLFDSNNEESFPKVQDEPPVVECGSEEVERASEAVSDTEINSSTLFTKSTLCNEDLLRNSLKNEPFLCAICPQEFKNQKSLRQHEKIHFETAASEAHICTECNRQYSTANLLEHHRKNAHKLREYACNMCGNAFKLKNQLNNHMKLHLEKNISCPHCDKKYARRFDLNVHLRSHTGEMPFECHLCDKKFAIKVRLTYHLQKHYGIKHVCKECGAQFNSKTKLKAHSFKHTGMPYRCELCDGHGFPNRDVFKRHLLRVHNATITEEDLLDMFQRNTGKSTRIRSLKNEEPSI